MPRRIPGYAPAAHGKMLVGGEPLVFHCNYYNYFLQKTVLLDETLGMDEVIVDAAYAPARAQLEAGARELGLTTANERRELAEHVFAQLGFGLLDLSGVAQIADGGAREARIPVSHYGQCLRIASGAEFASAQSLFDAGYVAAAADFVAQSSGASTGKIVACQSLGAPEGRVRVEATGGVQRFRSPRQGAHGDGPVPPPSSAANVDEPAILAALSGLDFSGNEEGLVPRFNVMLTHHYANFYNRMSFEFLHRMDGTGLVDAAEELLTEGGLRCAFHTFGGIMTSAEWNAVIRPQCKTREDWVHGMVATINALGWGVYRVHELVPGKRLVLRIHDDYESSGYLGMYGRAKRPISYLAAGGAAGLMNLVYVGNIESRAGVDTEDYEKIFESEARFSVKQTRCFAQGDAYTEIVAER